MCCVFVMCLSVVCECPTGECVSWERNAYVCCVCVYCVSVRLVCVLCVLCLYCVSMVKCDVCF